MRHDWKWYAIFLALIVVSFIAIYELTGQDAIGAAARFLWNGLILTFNALVRLASSLLGLLAKGVGWRRLSRVAAVIAGVGVGYAGRIVLSDDAVRRAYGWRGKLQAAITVTRSRWQTLPLALKLIAVAVLIASQVYLHALLIIFPVAFLVPVVRRVWVRTADLMFGHWYWRTFGGAHRSAVATMKRLPLVRQLIGGMRLTRLRYLSAWRLWRYHPRYRNAETGRPQVNLWEPVRLWWRGELDGYIGRPLLSGRKAVEVGAAE